MCRTNSDCLFTKALPFSAALVICLFFQSQVLAADGQLRAFAVRNTDSDSIVKILQQVFNKNDILMVSDARTNTIVVRADAAQLQQIQQIVAQLDKVGLNRAGRIRELARPRNIGRVRGGRIRKLKIVVQTLDDGSVEIRAPADVDYWVRGVAVTRGQKVKRRDALLLLDANNRELRTLLEQEVEQLRQHLADAEAKSRHHRDGQTEFDKAEFSRVAKRAAAIRSGISEKTRTLYRPRNASRRVCRHRRDRRSGDFRSDDGRVLPTWPISCTKSIADTYFARVGRRP